MKRQPDRYLGGHHRSLREFFYLDEVSVQSLASAVGQALMVGRVETVESTTTRSRRFGFGTKAGPANANVTLGREQARADGSQVEAKYNIQATFAQLKEVLATRAVLGVERRESTDSTDTSKALAPTPRDALRLAGVAIPVAHLSRGDVIELHAKIGAHSMYNLASLADSLSAIATKSPGVFGAGGQLQQFTDGANILNHMLGGLVPIEGIVTSHRVVDFPDGAWIIPSEEIPNFSDAIGDRDLFIVGVMERDLFWRDPRRILFEDLEYTVFGRATHGGLRDSWMPSKWFGPMNGLMTSFINEIEQIDFSPIASHQAEIDEALSTYVERIVAEFELTPDSPDTTDLTTAEADSLEQQLSLFDLVAHRTFGDQMTTIDQDHLARLRESIMQNAGLLLPEDWATPQTAQAPPSSKGPMIELDFVAGYW